MINIERIPIRQSLTLPSLSWPSRSRKARDSRNEAERAAAHRKKESFANAQRDAAQAKFFSMGYRRFY